MDNPFRIALLGDFSGRANRGTVETGRALASRRPVRVDRDSLDDAMAQLAPKLSLAIAPGEAPIELTFSCLDELHPDSLYQRVPHFRMLRDAGARAVATTSLLSGGVGTSNATQPPAGVLDAILGDAPLPPGGATLAETPVPTRSAVQQLDAGLAEFIKRSLASHLVGTPSQSETEARARLDATITDSMRALLHHADFQRLEAAWRGAAFLVRRLDTDSGLQVHLLDVSMEELATDLAEGPLDESGIYRLLVDGRIGTPGAPAWAVLAAAFSLGRNDEELRVVERLGSVARDARAPLLIGADPLLAGTASIAATPDPSEWTEDAPPAWSELRESSVAPYIALLFPRMLLRLPYGKDADACDLFTFEELAANHHPGPDELLWGSGSIAAAFLLGQAFTNQGWSLEADREISGLPLHVYRADGEAFAVPCAEATLSERAVHRLLDRGLSPLASVRDTDTVLVPRLQSIANRATTLLGRWTTAGNGDGD